MNWTRHVYYIFVFDFAISAEPIVNIKGLGFLKGISYESHSSFYGVPYAETHERFQTSEPIKSWINRDISRYKECYGNEDCEECFNLLNIHTSNSEIGNKSVLMWIGNLNNETLIPMLKSNEIIIIEVNYRKGFYGFSYSKQISSNLGLDDIKLARNWIFEHISDFGGDSGKFSIGGEQFEGSLAFYLGMMSSYIHKIILFSPWFDTRNTQESAYRKTIKFAKIMKCPKNKEFECLKTLNNTVVSKGIKMLSESFHYDEPIFSLIQNKIVISDQEIKRKTILLGENLRIGFKLEATRLFKILKRKKIEKKDGVPPINRTTYNEIIKNIFKDEKIANAISFFYTNWSIHEEFQDYFVPLVQLLTDNKYSCPIEDVINMVIDKVKLFRYKVSYSKTKNSTEEQTQFENSSLKEFLSSSWINFIKYGDPNLTNNSFINWPEYQPKKKYFLSADPYMVRVTSTFENSPRDCAFWNNLLKNFNAQTSNTTKIKQSRLDESQELITKENQYNNSQKIVSYSIRVRDDPNRKEYFSSNGTKVLVVKNHESNTNTVIESNNKGRPKYDLNSFYKDETFVNDIWPRVTPKTVQVKPQYYQGHWKGTFSRNKKLESVYDPFYHQHTGLIRFPDESPTQHSPRYYFPRYSPIVSN